MSRFHFSPGVRASQLLAEAAIDRTQPWLSDIPEPPPPLPRRQEIALLTLRHSGRGHAEQVLKALYARGEKPAVRSDYEALVGLQLAIRNKQGYHDITPIGHWRAGKIAGAIAAEIGLKLASMSRNPLRSGPQRVYGMSDGGNG